MGFAIQHPEQHSLSIRIRTDGFSFSLHSPLAEKPVSTTHYALDYNLPLVNNLKQMVATHSELLLPFKRTTVCFMQVPFCTIPLEHFVEGDATKLLGYCCQLAADVTVLHHTVENSGLVLLFAIPKVVQQWFQEQFAQVTFTTGEALLVEQLTPKSYLGNSRKLYADIQPEKLTLLAYERGKLLLVNSFACHELTDRAYYVLHTCKQLQLDTSHDAIHLMGEATGKKELQAELNKFMKLVFIQ